MIDQRADTETRRFEPMVLLVWGLPAAVVVAGFITLGIAIRSGELAGSTDDVRRMAQVQQSDLGADQAAQRRGLSASLRVDSGGVRLQLLGASEADNALTLRFEHPSDAGMDREVSLQREGDLWSASIALPEARGWRLVLLAADASWRLDGQLDGGDGVAVLTPRFGRG